jgi:hypothetical protein
MAEYIINLTEQDIWFGIILYIIGMVVGYLTGRLGK